MSESRDLDPATGPAAGPEGPPPPLTLRRHGPGRGAAWLLGAFGWLTAAPLAWIVAVILLVVIHSLLQMVPVLGSLASIILAPVFTGGLMLGCRAQERGEGFEIAHLFAGFPRHGARLAGVGASYFGLTVLVAFVMGIWIVAVAGTAGMAALQAGGSQAVSAGQAAGLLAGLLVGFALLVPVLGAVWLAPALVALHGLGPWEAMGLSLRGFLGNLLPFVVYGVLLLVLAVLAAIPIFLGFLILLPMMMISIYLAYRDIYRPEPAGGPA